MEKLGYDPCLRGLLLDPVLVVIILLLAVVVVTAKSDDKKSLVLNDCLFILFRPISSNVCRCPHIDSSVLNFVHKEFKDSIR